MSEKRKKRSPKSRRQFTEEFKREAIQMLLDGHSAASVVERLGLSGTNILYRWKREQLRHMGPVASSLEARVKELEGELRRRPMLRIGARRERDILKKALAIFSRSD